MTRRRVTLSDVADNLTIAEANLERFPPPGPEALATINFGIERDRLRVLGFLGQAGKDRFLLAGVARTFGAADLVPDDSLVPGLLRPGLIRPTDTTSSESSSTAVRRLLGAADTIEVFALNTSKAWTRLTDLIIDNLAPSTLQRGFLEFRVVDLRPGAVVPRGLLKLWSPPQETPALLVSSRTSPSDADELRDEHPGLTLIRRLNEDRTFLRAAHHLTDLTPALYRTAADVLNPDAAGACISARFGAGLGSR